MVQFVKIRIQNLSKSNSLFRTFEKVIKPKPKNPYLWIFFFFFIWDVSLSMEDWLDFSSIRIYNIRLINQKQLWKSTKIPPNIWRPDRDNSTAQKMKFSIKGFFSKCDQIRRKLRIWLSYLLKKSLMENFIFCKTKSGKCFLTHFILKFSFYTQWKHRKTFSFLMFAGL